MTTLMSLTFFWLVALVDFLGEPNTLPNPFMVQASVINGTIFLASCCTLELILISLISLGQFLWSPKLIEHHVGSHR